MYKLVILGCENSHADAFCSMIRDGLFPSLTVVGAYSEEPDAMKRLKDTFGIYSMKTPDEFVGKVDGVIVVARHGDRHFEYARPYLADRVPLFIDKPITCREEDAVAFMQALRTAGIPVCGGSVCPHMPGAVELRKAVADGTLGEIRGGHLSFPLSPNSPHGGFHFYAQHLTETLVTVFGQKIEQVIATVSQSGVAFIAKYPAFDVTANFLTSQENVVTGYHLTVFGSRETRKTELVFEADTFRAELIPFVELLEGKPMAKSYEEFIYPVFLNNAIVRSYESGRWEPLHPIVL